MSENGYRNVVVVRENGKISDFQLIMMSFRPVSFFEIEDHYEELCQEIIESVDNLSVRAKMLQFVSVFKSTIDTKSIEPMEKFLSENHQDKLSRKQLDGICNSIETFIQQDLNQPHLYN